MATSRTVPFNEHLQLCASISDCASAQAGEFHFPWRPEYANSSGSYHGGALMAMADAAMSRALQTRLTDGQRATTVQMNSSFIATAAEDVIISVHPVKIGSRIAHCNASITTTSGKILFNATATFAITAAT